MRIPLFDNDGTLLVYGSSNKVHHDAFEEALHTTFHLPHASMQDLPSPGGKIDSQILIEIAEVNGMKREDAIALLPEAFIVMTTYFSLHKNEGTPQAEKGAKELLALLKQHTYVGVLTGNVEEIGYIKLEQAGLKEYIDFGAFGNLALKRSDLVRIAQERFFIQFGEEKPIADFVIIGDTPRDIYCAREGGTSVIAVATGAFTMEDLAKEKPDLIIQSLEEKEKIIDFLTA